MKTSTMRRALIALLIIPASCLPLSACSSAGDMTCEEYLDLPIIERSSVHTDLLREHDLDLGSTDNILGISENISSFCSNDANSDEPLDNAVDWESSTW